MEKYNPLKSWRGRLSDDEAESVDEAASLLRLSQQTYLELEAHPTRMCLTTDIIFRIQEVTGIPLAALVDWLTETTKEATP